MIYNCLINPEVSFRSNHIYVPARTLLQGGIKICRNPDEKLPKVLLSTDISLHHKNIELYFNFYMNRMPFLHTNLSKINFLTAEICISKSTDKIIKKMNTVTNM